MLFTPGNRVMIKTIYGGSYNGKTGVVIAYNTDEKKEVGKSGYRFSPWCPGWIRVRFDEPIPFRDSFLFEESFMPTELTVFDEEGENV